jgi:hypothetical protein
MCGLIAQYDATGAAPGPNLLPATMRQILSKSLTLRGFINRFGTFAAGDWRAKRASPRRNRKPETTTREKWRQKQLFY